MYNPTKSYKDYRYKDKVWFNVVCRRAFNDKHTAYKLWSQNKFQRCCSLLFATEANYNQQLQNTLSSLIKSGIQ